MPTTVEEITVSLPVEIASSVRDAVDAGDYASSSEVVRDALRDWSDKRRMQPVDLSYLREMWQEAIEKNGPYEPAGPVLDRFVRKYQAIADNASKSD